MDLEVKLSLPSERRRLLGAAIRELRQGQPPDMLVSSGTEALVLTSLLAGELRLPMAYLRPEAKSHGRQQRLEGKLQGSNLALIAVRPTAETLHDNTDLLAEQGAHISRVVNVADLAADLGLTSTAIASPAAAPAGPQSEGIARTTARILLDIGAVVIRAAPFRYASGLLSPIYTDCRLLISYPTLWPTIIDSLQAAASTRPFETVAGVATSGIPHASLLAQRLDKPLVYATEDRLVGAATEGGRLVVIEDLVTTGKSVLEAAAVLRQHGLSVDRCVSIFTYNRLQPALQTAGISFEPLSDLETLLELGVDERFFGQNERAAVLDWRSDPQGWTERHEPGR